VKNALHFAVTSKAGQRGLDLSVEHLWNGGWAGRNPEDVRRHIEEIAALGVSAPRTTPIWFPLSNHLATTSDRLQALGPASSGEIEYALLVDAAGDVYVTIASDHSDRAMEQYGIQLAKQLYPDVLAPEVWPYAEVAPHWDQLRLRCWFTWEGTRTLYQDALASELLSADQWLHVLSEEGIRQPGLVFLSGTPNSVAELVSADAYDLEFTDPVLGRNIRHHYEVEVLRPAHV
jgi:hypothetical protein